MKNEQPSPPSDPAHLFMQLFDSLDADLFRGPEPRAWLRDEETGRRALKIDEAVAATGVADLDHLSAIAGWAGQRGRFTVLLGLDEALVRASPFIGGYLQCGMTAIAARYARTGLLNDPRVAPGALLPRCTIAGRPLSYTRREDFFSVLPIKPGAFGPIEFGSISPRYDPHFDPEQPIRIGCTPFIDSYKDLEFTVGGPDAYPVYRVRPVHSDGLTERIRLVLQNLDRAGAHIGVIPEICLSERLLDEWRGAAIDTYQEGRPLRWLLLGSGPVDGSPTPANRTVLLDRATGETIFEYDKRHGFTISRQQVSDWRLPLDLAQEATSVEEDIKLGSRIPVRDSSLGRTAALICEDLAQSTDWEREFVAFGVSHLFIPIFSKPVFTDGWEARDAERQVRQLGAWVVVSNSLAVLRDSGFDTTRERFSSLVFGPDDRARNGWDVKRDFCLADSPAEPAYLSGGHDRSMRLPTVRAGFFAVDWLGRDAADARSHRHIPETRLGTETVARCPRTPGCERECVFGA